MALERLCRCCVLQGRPTEGGRFISSAAGVWSRLNRREDKIRCLRVLKDVNLYVGPGCCVCVRVQAYGWCGRRVVCVCVCVCMLYVCVYAVRVCVCCTCVPLW